MPSDKKAKKDKKPKVDDSDEDVPKKVVDSDSEPEEKPKKKKKPVVADSDSEPEEKPKKKKKPVVSDSDSEPEEKPKKKKKPVVADSDSEPEEKPKKKKKPVVADSDSEPEEKTKKKKKPVVADSDSEQEEKKKKKEKKDKKAAEEFDFGEKKKKKKPKENGDAPEEVEATDKKKKKKSKIVPVVGLILEVQPVPKKDKLRICKIRIGEDQDTITVVTSAPNVCKGSKFVVALPGTKLGDIEVTVTTIGGVESSGMLCGPKELGWDTDVLEDKKAVMLDEDAEVGSPCPSYEEAVEAFREREKAEAAKVAAAAKAEAAKGKKKKGGKAAAEDDEDLDALLGEFGVQVDESAAAGGKKNKKKGKAAAKKDEDDDFEAALADAKATEKEKVPEKEEEPKKDSPPVKEEEPKKEESPPVKEEAPKAEPAEAKGDAGEEALDAKTLANRKKKDKKKAKQAVGGAGMWAGAGDDDDDAKPAASSSTAPAPDAAEAPAPEPAPEPKKAAGKKGAAPKKESAAVKAARERMEMQRQLDEERRIFEEAERKRIEEEERAIREEEERIAAEKQRKRDAKEAKIARMKAEGTYLTAKEKLRKQRAEELKKQFGFDMDALGEEEDGGEDKKQTKRPPLASKKKKQPQQKKVEEEEEEAEKPEKKEEEPAKPEPKAKAKAEVKKPAVTEEEDDAGWEDEAEKEEAEAEDDDEKDAEDEEESSSDEDNSDSDSDGSSDFLGYRSPIVCIMGHVDTGKTKLLDKIRRTNVQEGEAGGITQQIGATFFPDIALNEQTKKVNEDFEIEVPGLLIIDTPGHESFNNLRKRGSSLCDLAILVIDIMHGLEPQTVESLEMLKKRKCPFIIALNKIDVCYGWKSEHYTSIESALERQDASVREEFNRRKDNVLLQLAERGLNCGIYYENEDYKSTVSIVPTSALTGEGVPDLLFMLLTLAQELMASSLEVEEELQCTVIEVKAIEGHGTTIDVVLVNGTLREGDQIVIAGMTGPIVTTIRALLTPQPMKEMRVKGEYIHHAKINTSMGVKISAPDLEQAVAGTELKVVGPDDDIEELKDEVQSSFDSIISDFDKQPAGVYVKASTLGSLEALLSFLQDMKIPVFDVGIGEVHKKDVKRALIMKEKSHPEYAVILAFDVKISSEATEHAKTEGVQIMAAEIIYHLFDRFTQYMKQIQEANKQNKKLEAVFPSIIQIDKQCIFHKRDPLIVGVDVMGGQLRIGTPICVPERDFLEIGRVGGIEKDKKPVQIARRGDRVCVKIEQNTQQSQIAIGRHFEVSNQLYSKISRESIDTLKEHFRDEMKKEDWELIIGMKTVFKIQ